MSDLITFELTANGNAIVMKSNLLALTPDITYKCVIIPINSIDYMVEEDVQTDGINVILHSGNKHTVMPNYVTKIGTTTYTHPITIAGLGSFLVCPDNDTLLADLLTLMNW